MSFKRFCTAIFFFLNADLALANQAQNVPTNGHALLQTLTGLLAVLVVIFMLAWLAKRLNFGGMASQNVFKPIATLPLGTREKAILVEVGGQQMLLGVAPGRVSKLHVFDQPVTVMEQQNPKQSSMVSSGVNHSRKSVDFATKLKEILAQSPKAE